MAYPVVARQHLLDHRQTIEKEGTARQHGDTLEKRGISVDDLLNPSRENHSKKGGEWDTLLGKWIKEKSSADVLSKRMSALELSSARP